MKKIISFGMLCAVGLSCAGNVSAKDKDLGTPDKWSYEILHSFARCVVNRQPDKVIQILNAEPRSKASNDLAGTLTEAGSCLRVATGAGERASLRMGGDTIRGALAEELYLKSYATPPAAPSEEQAVAPFQGSGKPQLASYDVVMCATLRDPIDADALVRSKPDTDAEKAALKNLMPVLSKCLPTGANLGFDREALHGLAAEGLWKMRKADSQTFAARPGS